MKRLSILVAFCLLAPTHAFCAEQPAGHAGASAEPAIRGTADTGELKEPHKGKVVQIINSGGYTYVQLKKKSGEKIWIAVPDAQIEVGSQQTFNPGMLMTNFQSKTLNRTFDQIYFTDMPAPPKGKKDKEVKGKSPGSAGSVSPDVKVKVKKATGKNAYTISELYKNKAKLDKKQVRVRGKVVKVSPNIMGKTWVHLRDGSGSHATADFNLVVTTQSVPAEGETVTVTGTLYKNKDFGGGYKYDVIVEKAEMTVE